MKREDVFEQLAPPPGGLAGLRERMAERPPAMARARLLVPLAATLAVAAAFSTWWSSNRPPELVAAARRRGGVDQVALGLGPARPAAIAGAEGTSALAEVPSKDAAVSFYWVSSTEWKD